MSLNSLNALNINNIKVFSTIDQLLICFDQSLRTLTGTPTGTGRASPGESVLSEPLTQGEKRTAANLMRINQTGEIAAQALYQGQALTAKNPKIRALLEHAALEENDHLRWCANRVKELNSHGSILNPFWYLGSFALGAFAGIWGDKWSLGFLAETEKQVSAHLEKHLNQLPGGDHKSRAIVSQMWKEETEHAFMAIEHGGIELPAPIKWMMKGSAKIMTTFVYYF